MHSFQLESSNSEQADNPWISRSNNDDTSLSTIARNRQLDDTDSVFRSDALQSPDMILSPTPPPPSAQPILHAQPPMEETDTTPTDPHVASLKAIFPDFDDAVILSVLESTNYDHDRALDVLLGMNDPSFVPPAPPPSQTRQQDQLPSVPSSGAQRLSQEELDEQFARRLALEEEQLASQAWAPQGMDGQTGYQAYQPRRGRRNERGDAQPQTPPQTTQGQGGRDTMAEFQEGFNRVAESGKKTFSSIMSKVRAKMQEFDQGQGWSGSQSPPGQPPQSAASSYYPGYASGQQQASGQGAYTQPPGPPTQTSPSASARTSTYGLSPPRSGVLRPAAAVTDRAQPAISQQSSYYDPNSQGYDLYGDDEDIQIIDRTTPPSAAATTAVSTTTQNPSPATPPQLDMPAVLSTPSRSDTLPSYTSPVTPPSISRLSTGSPPARSLSPTTTGAKPGGVDFSKLGLLPKRPISLVQPQPQPVAGAGAGASLNAPHVAVAHLESTTASLTEGREEPEFVENPFEDQT